jgi:spermidine synthase
MKLPTAWKWSALSGFLALSWEIVWARVFNFVSGSQAPVFGYMLAAYLAGLTLGSLTSRRWLSKAPGAMLQVLAQVVAWSTLAAFAVAPLTAVLACLGVWQWSYAAVTLAAAGMGIVFPLLCHAAVQADDAVGARLSGLYLANILGSGAGSLLTGFLLMDVMPLWALSCALLLAGALWSVKLAGSWRMQHLKLKAALLLLCLWPLAGLWERLQYKTDYTAGMRFPVKVESKHGVITVDSNHRVYGNGAYDGMIEAGLEPGSWMLRPYFLSAVQPQMKKVLVIGVASGGWTQIFANHPQVESVTAVELSKGYLEIISHYPQVRSLLTNPKVHLVIDDGRRWLRRHPAETFDAIVMNTTHHWREFASALLSQEFLTEVKAHLNAGGIAFWNCTESPRAARTGMAVFPHTMMVMNHCLASNEPLRIDATHWQQMLSRYRINEEPLFDLQADSGKRALEEVLSFVEQKRPFTREAPWCWMDRAMMEEVFGSAAVITDDNLGHEYP